MFLEFDISISHSVRDTFLSTGNEVAYKVSAWNVILAFPFEVILGMTELNSHMVAIFQVRFNVTVCSMS